MKITQIIDTFVVCPYRFVLFVVYFALTMIIWLNDKFPQTCLEPQVNKPDSLPNEPKNSKSESDRVSGIGENIPFQVTNQYMTILCYDSGGFTQFTLFYIIFIIFYYYYLTISI